MKSRQEPKIRRIVGAVALLVIASVLVWRFLPRERLLLQRATCIASVSGIPNPFTTLFNGKGSAANPGSSVDVFSDGYSWKSDREVVLFHPSAGQPPGYEAFRLDVQTGTQESLPALNREIATGIRKSGLSAALPAAQRTLLALWSRTGNFLSPDGKWMLLLYPTGKSSGQFIALTLDGSQRRIWQASSTDLRALFNADQIIWMPDNRQWIQLQENNEGNVASVLVRDIAAPRAVRSFKIAISPNQRSAFYMQMYGSTNSGDLLLGYLDYQAFDLSAKSKVKSQEMILVRLDLGHPGTGPALAPVRRYFVPMPLNWHLPASIPWPGPAPTLSPKGGRLAWLVAQDFTPPGPAWIRHFEAFCGMRPHTMVGLWVSRLDGSQMQEIGHIDYKPGEEVPQDIRWTPDGERLSFLYKGALYTVPAREY